MRCILTHKHVVLDKVDSFYMHVTVVVMEREFIPKQTRVQVKNERKINPLAVDTLLIDRI